MQYCDMVAMVSATAIGLYKCLDEDQFTLLADVYVALGDMMALILTSEEIREACIEKCCGSENEDASVNGPIA